VNAHEKIAERSNQQDEDPDREYPQKGGENEPNDAESDGMTCCPARVQANRDAAGDAEHKHAGKESPVGVQHFAEPSHRAKPMLADVLS
jgi:hypothetical protein